MSFPLFNSFCTLALPNYVHMNIGSSRMAHVKAIYNSYTCIDSSIITHLLNP